MDELEVFSTALEIASDEDRARYLDQACGDDRSLRGRIEALLDSWRRADAFLTSPAPNLASLVHTNTAAGRHDRDSAATVGTLGDFRLVREIGRGGMGVVYEAEQISLRRRVALKVLPLFDALNPRQLVRFHNESRAAASLRHPNIVSVHFVGFERGLHYYAMDFVDGRTLADVIAHLPRVCGVDPQTGGTEANPHACESLANMQASPVSAIAPIDIATLKSDDPVEFFRLVAQWGIQAAEGLDHAHVQGIVHRDIKPSNLMVDVKGHLWVTDFGLAMGDAIPGPTITGDLLGTLRYMSPEQAAGKRRVLDGRTDIYSLGVTLYELVTLQPAFPGDNLQQVLRQIAEKDPVPPHQLNSSMPRDLETIIIKAMAKEPAARYQTSHDLALDLRRFSEDEPIHARRPSLAARAALWSRRHRPLIWSGAVMGVFVVAVLISSTLLVLAAYQREKTQRRIADENAARAEDNAKEARQIAAKAREVANQAQSNYETAREVVKQMLTRVGDELLVTIPEMKDVRRRLLVDAAAFYSELMTLNPGDPQAYYERGQVYDLLQQYDKVRPDYEKAIELDPDNAAYHGALGRFSFACEDVAFRDLECAALHIRRALQLDPQNHVYHHDLALHHARMGETDQAACELQKAAELTDSEAGRMMFQAAACKIACDLRGSLEWEKKAMALHPDDRTFHLHLADLYFRLGEFENAIAAATKCIELAGAARSDSADKLAYTYLEPRADAYAALRMYREALSDYDKAVELAPFHSYLYKRRALVHFLLEDHDKALADVAKAVELKPDDTSNVGWIPLQLVARSPDRRFLQDMFELADKTVRMTGTNVEAYCIRARLHAALGRWEGALADFEQIRSLHPSHRMFPRPPAHAEAYVIHFGLLQPDQDRWPRAIDHLHRQLRSTASSSPAWLHWVSAWLPAMLNGTDHLPGTVFVSDLPWVRSSFGRVVVVGYSPSRAVRETDHAWGDGTAPIAQLPYSKSIQNHAFPDARPADVVVDVSNRDFAALKAIVGPCEDGAVQFQVLLDGSVASETPVMRLGDVQAICVDVAAAKEVVLRVLNGGDGNPCLTAGWGYARFLEANALDLLEEPPSELRAAFEANAALLLAEVHWHLDQKELARRWYDRAAAWLDKNQRVDEDLQRCLGEAAALLGIPEEA